MRCRLSFSIGSISTFATSASAPTLPSAAFNLYLRATSCRFCYLAPFIFQTSTTELPRQLPGVSSSELSLAQPSPELRTSAKNAAHTDGAAVHTENWSERIPIGLKEFCAPAFTSQAWRDACFSCVELTTMYFAFYHAPSHSFETRLHSLIVFFYLLCPQISPERRSFDQMPGQVACGCHRRRSLPAFRGDARTAAATQQWPCCHSPHVQE